MEQVKIKSRYKNHSPREFAFTCEGESLTQQQFVEECDVNNILAKYRRTGLVTHLSKHSGQFGDFSNIEDYQTSLGKIMQAQQSFEMLPSELRSKFGNDPGKLIEFMSDEKNLEDCYKFGLKIRPEKKETIQEAMEKALETKTFLKPFMLDSFTDSRRKNKYLEKDKS